MKSKNKNTQKGITLVALIITIIILLILAGISISALTGSGLFGKAQDAKERTIKAQLKEEIEMAIQEIQLEEIPKGKSVTLESLAKGQLLAKLTEITAELGTNEITGEYKDYDYTIDSNFKIEIGGKVSGIKPTGTAEILTTGYIFEGAGTVQIKITASITEGTITGIEAPSGATLTTDTSTTEKIYTVEKNGTYVFGIVGDSGRKTNVTVRVENILSVPQIKVDEVTANGFKISVENNYPDGAITEYKYYVGDKIKKQGTTDKSCSVTDLSEDTKYSNIKVVAYINESTSKESNVETVTILGTWSEEYKTTSDYTDAYGNVAKIPEGFQVSTKVGQTNINEGLVVRNATDKNEFVWIPVGKIYTDTERTEANAKTIELNRYTFDSSGNPTPQNDDVIDSHFQELATSTFKKSVSTNKGFYIGRYEARRNRTITEVGTDTVWNDIIQQDAATVARNMYKDATTFTSDLMNSYAWDTATLFLQTCGDNPTYSRKTSVNSKFATTGTNDTTKYTGTQDIQCNIYDMASNVLEWTTETYSPSSRGSCVNRGGYCDGSNIYTSYRNNNSRSYSDVLIGFRPLLYLQV